MTEATIEVTTETMVLAETIVGQVMGQPTDPITDHAITTDRETLMDQDPTMDPITDHAITMAREITTDQDPIMDLDQTIDHLKEATLVHHNPN